MKYREFMDSEVPWYSAEPSLESLLVGRHVGRMHIVQCETGFLVDCDFRREASEATGMEEWALEASAVDDPYTTVEADVELLLSSPLLPRGMAVSGHVYDVETGRVTTVVDTRYAAVRTT